MFILFSMHVPERLDYIMYRLGYKGDALINLMNAKLSFKPGLSGCWFISWLLGWGLSVGRNFLKGEKVSLPCS